jgi:hypothetical protein
MQRGVWDMTFRRIEEVRLTGRFEAVTAQHAGSVEGCTRSVR